MTTVQVEISEELAQELTPYQQHLSELLELGLIEWKKLRQEEEAQRLHQTLTKLANEGKVIMPTPAAQPYQRTTPIKLAGKPLSEIVIEQRGTLP
ncbi:MAG: hypothetical protein R3E79_48260 [Caldilineaceae bacterium]